MRLIDFDGQQVGVVDIKVALSKAEESGFDLVEISPNIVPPVCRIMDYGKYLFEQSKKSKKKSKQIHLKELKMRPGTDVGDYQIKLRKATEFLQDGDKVKITIRFRGREVAYQGIGRELLERIIRDLQEFGSVDQNPRFEGKQLTAVIAPAKSTSKN